MSTRKVITAPEQEADLPYGTVVLLADGSAALLNPHAPGRQWWCTDATYITGFEESELPALVLYEPDGSEDTGERQREWLGTER